MVMLPWAHCASAIHGRMGLPVSTACLPRVSPMMEPVWPVCGEAGGTRKLAPTLSWAPALANDWWELVDKCPDSANVLEGSPVGLQPRDPHSYLLNSMPSHQASADGQFSNQLSNSSKAWLTTFACFQGAGRPLWLMPDGRAGLPLPWPCCSPALWGGCDLQRGWWRHTTEPGAVR